MVNQSHIEQMATQSFVLNAEAIELNQRAEVGVIIGIAVGSLLLIGLSVLTAVLLIRKKKAKRATTVEKCSTYSEELKPAKSAVLMSSFVKKV